MNPELQNPWRIFEVALGILAGLVVLRQVARWLRRRLEVPPQQSALAMSWLPEADLPPPAGPAHERDRVERRRGVERRLVILAGALSSLVFGVLQMRGALVVLFGVFLITGPRAIRTLPAAGQVLASLAALWVLDQVLGEILRRWGPKQRYPLLDLDLAGQTAMDVIGRGEEQGPDPERAAPRSRWDVARSVLVDNVVVWLLVFTLAWLLTNVLSPILSPARYVRARLGDRAPRWLSAIVDWPLLDILHDVARRRPTAPDAMSAAVDRVMDPRGDPDLEPRLLQLAQDAGGRLSVPLIVRTTGLGFEDAARLARTLVDLHGGTVDERAGVLNAVQLDTASKRRADRFGSLVVSSSRARLPVWAEDERMPEETGATVRALVIRTPGLRSADVTALLRLSGGVVWGALWAAVLPYFADGDVGLFPLVAAARTLAELAGSVSPGVAGLAAAVLVGAIGVFAHLVLYVAVLDVRRASYREVRRVVFREAFDAAEQNAGRNAHEVLALVLRHLGGSRNLFEDAEVMHIVDRVFVELRGELTPEGQWRFPHLAPSDGP